MSVDWVVVNYRVLFSKLLFLTGIGIGVNGGR